MSLLPAYVNMVFLAVIAAAISVSHRPIQQGNAYLSQISAMVVCHEALLQFGDKNPGTTGTIEQSQVDAFLAPGALDPGLFTYVIDAPGVAATYLSTSNLNQQTVILLVQKLSGYAVTAGAVSGGNIVPAAPAPAVAAIAGIPNNTIAIQTPLS